jgi:hypothetical protein
MAAAEAGEARGQGGAKHTMTGSPPPEYANISEVRLRCAGLDPNGVARNRGSLAAQALSTCCSLHRLC